MNLCGLACENITLASKHALALLCVALLLVQISQKLFTTINKNLTKIKKLCFKKKNQNLSLQNHAFCA